MGLRQQIAENPVIGMVVVVILVGLAGWLIAGSKSAPVVNQSFYYDLDQGRLFTDDAGKAPPFKTATGQTAVIAAVFSCGDCVDASSRFLGYLEKYSDEYLAARGDPDMPADVAEKGQLIRLEQGEWVVAASEDGRRITAEVRSRCGGEPPKACHP